LETVGEKTSREDTQKERQQRDYGERKSRFAKTEFLIIDGKVDTPSEEGDAGESDTGSGDDHRKIGGYHEQTSNGNYLGTRAAGRIGYFENEEPWNHANNSDDDEGEFPTVNFPHEAAEGLARGAPEKHARREDGLSHGAALVGEGIGNHGL